MPKPSTPTNNKVRGTVTAYNLFVRTCREELRRKYPQLNVDYTVIAKKCSERWKGMNEIEKKRFNDTADLQRKRFQEELASHQVIVASTPPINSKFIKKREKKVKDPLAPKKPLSAYFLFCADERPKLLNSQTGENNSKSSNSIENSSCLQECRSVKQRENWAHDGKLFQLKSKVNTNKWRWNKKIFIETKWPITKLNYRIPMTSFRHLYLDF